MLRNSLPDRLAAAGRPRPVELLRSAGWTLGVTPVVSGADELRQPPTGLRRADRSRPGAAVIGRRRGRAVKDASRKAPESVAASA